MQGSRPAGVSRVAPAFRLVCFVSTTHWDIRRSHCPGRRYRPPPPPLLPPPLLPVPESSIPTSSSTRPRTRLRRECRRHRPGPRRRTWALRADPSGTSNSLDSDREVPGLPSRALEVDVVIDLYQKYSSVTSAPGSLRRANSALLAAPLRFTLVTSRLPPTTSTRSV